MLLHLLPDFLTPCIVRHQESIILIHAKAFYRQYFAGLAFGYSGVQLTHLLQEKIYFCGRLGIFCSLSSAALKESIISFTDIFAKP